MRLTLIQIPAALAILAAAPRPPAPVEPAATVERTTYAMGTLLRLEVTAPQRATALAASEAALAEVARLEAVLSSWRSDSEVGRLNAAPTDEPWPLGAELWALLEEASSYLAITAGAFDPGVGALLDTWDLQGAGRTPGRDALAQALAASGLLRLRRDAGSRTAARPGEAWRLDTGGFAKGAALRSAATVLQAHGATSALLDFGGQLLVLGPARQVAVAHPGERTRAMPLRLTLGSVSVSTTSSSERFVTVAGARYGHVLDPRTGQPVPAWGSVTVVAADALAADALSTGLFVLGPAAALTWAAAHPEYGVLVQEFTAGDVVVRSTPNLLPYLESNYSEGANER